MLSVSRATKRAQSNAGTLRMKRTTNTTKPKERPCQSKYLSIKDTLNRGHLSNEDTVCSPSYIELCTNLPLN